MEEKRGFPLQKIQLLWLKKRTKSVDIKRALKCIPHLKLSQLPAIKKCAKKP